MKILFRLTVFLYLITNNCFAQEFGFNHLNTQNGLSQNSVLAIAQDSLGFMWFGTQYGLNRFDSKGFKVYQNNEQNKHSISSNYILCLLSDSRHTLWVGTSYGLNKYHPESDAFEQIFMQSANNAILKNNTINCIYETKKGELWVGTDKGLRQLTDRNKNSFKPLNLSEAPMLASNNIRTIFEDSKNNLWVGTDKGLVKMLLKNGKLQAEIFVNNNAIPNTISDDYITSIIEDKLHNLWIGTRHGGLNLYHENNHTFTPFLHADANPKSLLNNNIRDLLCDKLGNIWIGTQEGLSILDPKIQSFISYKHDPENVKSISQNSIYSLFMDNNNTIWLGTFFGGVNSISSYKTTFSNYSKNNYHSTLINNVISSIVEDNNSKNLWIGTEGDGLNYLNRQNNTITNYQNKPNNPFSVGSNLIKVVYKDKSGNIWIGTHGGGLNVLDKKTNHFIRYLYNEKDQSTFGLEILAILETSNNQFWVATQKGLKIFHRNNLTLTIDDQNTVAAALGNISISSLLEDSEKQIWIGTLNGLYYFNPENNKIILLNRKNTNPSINTIFEDHQQQIWFSEYYGGLSKYNKTEKNITTYTEKDGLSNNNVLGILEDKRNNLWISTSNGLAKYNPSENSFNNYTTSDGLTGNIFNNNSFLKTTNDEMFFGGYNGLISFLPENIDENKMPPPLVFTDLYLFNDPINLAKKNSLLNNNINFTKNIELKYNENLITIKFASLNFVKPEKNTYKYTLEGFDNGWNRTNNPTATYTNLPVGNYLFRANGTNNDGVWGNPITLKITVLPPFWRTWWAYSFYILLILFLSFSVIRFFFLRALLERDQELTQLKINFFTNISHEIRTHLSLITGPVEKLLMSEKSINADSIQLQTIKTNSDNLLELVNELMDFRKAETGNLLLHIGYWNIVAFLNSIYDSFRDVAVSRNIQTEFITTANIMDVYFDKEQLRKVFTNILSNAYKFTPNGGIINIIIENKKGSVEIKIIDNGKGISPKNIEKLFDNYYQENDHNEQNTGYGIGLALAKSIVELHKGNIAVESNIQLADNRRTCFTVTLLTGKAHFSENQIIANPIPSLPEAHLPNEKFELANTYFEPKSRNQEKGLFTILLIEDNQEVRSFIKEVLKNHYTIFESENGKLGLDTAIEVIPDIIISDVMMPEMDGFTLCSKLKSDERTSHIPVILLTAKTGSNNQINGLEVGADIYLTKPFSIQMLLLHLRNLLSYREKLRQQISNQIVSLPAITIEHEDGELRDEKIGLNTIDNDFLQKVISIIEAHIDDPELNVTMLSRKVAMSYGVLYKKLAAITGLTIHDFIKSIRLKKAAYLLTQKGSTIYEVAYQVGFSDRKYFSKEFKKQFGKNPSDYIKTNLN